MSYSSKATDWAPAGTPAFQVWLCGRCSGELVNTDPRSCETCGARYDTESGEYVGGSGRHAPVASSPASETERRGR